VHWAGVHRMALLVVQLVAARPSRVIKRKSPPNNYASYGRSTTVVLRLRRLSLINNKINLWSIDGCNLHGIFPSKVIFLCLSSDNHKIAHTPSSQGMLHDGVQQPRAAHNFPARMCEASAGEQPADGSALQQSYDELSRREQVIATKPQASVRRLAPPFAPLPAVSTRHGTPWADHCSIWR
jgi:hypothetical protein